MQWLQRVVIGGRGEGWGGWESGEKRRKNAFNMELW